MQHARGVLDTSAVIGLAGIDPHALPYTQAIATITLAELWMGAVIATLPREQADRAATLETVLRSFELLPFDARAAWAFSHVAATLRESGRKAQARRFDALIAATALANDLPLYTANASDVAGIDGLEVVEVPAS
jgi:predicted nucleic acid-binding protein